MWVGKLCVHLTSGKKNDCSNQELRLDTAGVKVWRIGLNLHTDAHTQVQGSYEVFR